MMNQKLCIAHTKLRYTHTQNGIYSCSLEPAANVWPDAAEADTRLVNKRLGDLGAKSLISGVFGQQTYVFGESDSFSDSKITGCV